MFSDREYASLLVKNTGDRPIQVGSHFHFYEVNPALHFDRNLAFGMRLKIPAGLALRFEPGEERVVKLVSFGGEKKIYGLNGKTNGSVTHASKDTSFTTPLSSNSTEREDENGNH
nr:urease subunit beta [Longirhabdus pacifica]